MNQQPKRQRNQRQPQQHNQRQPRNVQTTMIVVASDRKPRFVTMLLRYVSGVVSVYLICIYPFSMVFKTELLIVLPMFFNFYYQIINLEMELKKVTVMSYIYLLITPAIQLELVLFA